MAEQTTVIPMMAYGNGPAAMDWPARAIGFRELMRMLTPEGRLSHCEMEAGGGVIILATPSPHYRGPKRHPEDCADARKWSEVQYIIDGVLVYAEDVNAHFERARAAGSTMLSPLEEGPGGVRYRAEDVEGHRRTGAQ